ncbi:aminotransferase class V-fold PLP-dependent enzyme [Chlorogloeopsis sp. ULAP01]|uniref:aminotransferase class V-fold PLP-dependent enzyme n=1 Tax=Chlorogloeopsis sp. ULAP01 TaxID=3056483 RepID=UPI0025AB2A36|nr:aminotransferase class V-fold PLP-dependent enzyme [Chlorogloeopsis sp. ULAP01]MDM9385711.1 aminotransferase class V-fold PLP-dependent enzyme [Chlorogloeopsis sp. ULAP01]
MTISVIETKLHLHRQKFPALANKTYFNYGGQGPMAKASMNAITQAQAYIQEIGPFGNAIGKWIGQEVKATRAAIASELNVQPQTISITENVTVGCNITMWGIDWQAGDHLLLSDCEHHSVVAIAQEISRRYAIEVTTCPLMSTLNEGDPVAIVAQHLRPNTRLVILSHILWNTGQILPLDKIARKCRENNSLLLIDAAQSVGLLSLDLTALGVDFYAFTGHKWLCGPAGIGGLYVHPEIRASLKPTFVGWRSVITDSQGMPMDWQPDGQCYEVATSDYPLYAGLREAIAIHRQWGTAEERYQQICRNSEYLWQQLRTLPNIHLLLTSAPESGLVSFQLAQNTHQSHPQLVNFLESQGLFIRIIANPNCVRACVHYFTLESEIDKLVEGIREWLVVNG